jgi:CRP-like cAMP-binding protein
MVAQDIEIKTANRLLRLIPEEERDILLNRAELVDLRVGEILYDIDDYVEYVYFPESGVISIVLLTGDGGSVEAGVCGTDGMVGIALVLKGQKALRRAQVQLSGTAIRVPASDFERLLRESPTAEEVFLGYVRDVVVFVSQIALCNARHTVEQRLSRWLLLIHDLVDGQVLPLTHEFIANMLGSRRAGVTQAAGTLKEAGAIDYTRGTITIVSREKLMELSCECYQALHSLWH